MPGAQHRRRHGGGTRAVTTQERRGFLTRFFREELRPPGARPEPEFLERCIQCNRCVASCPYQAIKPADWRYGLAVGTPIIEPREIPCYLCMICPDVCPTGALEPVAKEAVAMGVAIIDRDTCFAFQGIVCRSCIDICPYQGTAIEQNLKLRPRVHPCSCVGCGLCVKVCPVQPEAIRVVRT